MSIHVQFVGATLFKSVRGPSEMDSYICTLDQHRLKVMKLVSVLPMHIMSRSCLESCLGSREIGPFNFMGLSYGSDHSMDC